MNRPILPMLLALAVASVGRAAPTPEAVDDALNVAANDRAAAIALLVGALDDVRPPQRGEVLLHLGEQHRLSNRPSDARAKFLLVLDDRKAGRFADAARLGLALIDTERGDAATSSWQALVTVAPDDALDTQNASRFLTLAERAASQDRADERDVHAARARSYAAHDPGLLSAIDARLASLDVPTDLPAPPTDAPLAEPGLVPQGPPDDDVQVPGIPEPEPEPELAPEEAIVAARLALAQGDRQAARDAVADLLDHEEWGEAARLVDKASRAAAVDPLTIGVLLPFSGRYASVARHVKEALLDGWEQRRTEKKLVFVDSGGTSESAVQALDALVLDKGVLAVVGPLLSVETPAVVERAEAYGVPLVTMSQAVEDPGARAWTYQAWLTPTQQVDALLDYVHDTKGMKSFAIFAPDNDYGHGAADLFRADVVQRGGTIAIEVFYNATTNDMSHDAARLARRSLDSDRPAIVDYDAIFLPEKARRVPLAASGLAYAEVPVGTFKPGGKRGVPLLGLSGWNGPDLVTSGGVYTRTGLFTDVYAPPPTASGISWYPREGWRPFTERLTARIERTPTAIEALASDAGLAVATAAALGPRTRAAFRDALTSMQIKGSPTGATRFSAGDHLLERRIEVFQVLRSGFRPETPED